MPKYIGLLIGFFLILFGLFTIAEALIFPPIIVFNLFFIITGIYVLVKCSHRLATTIIIAIIIIGFSIYYLNVPYKGVKIIQTDLGNKIEERVSLNSFGTYQLPNTSDGINLLITRGNRLYGVKTTDDFTHTNIVKTTMKYQDSEGIGTSLNKLILGCNTSIFTCFILEPMYDYQSYRYFPAQITSYQYNTQTFSLVYLLTNDTHFPSGLFSVDIFSTQAMITTSDNNSPNAINNVYVLDIPSGNLQQTSKIANLVPLETISFIKTDPNYLYNEFKKGIPSGDKEIKVFDKSDCGAGGLTGCSSSITIYINGRFHNNFSCHNCGVRFAGKKAGYLYLLIVENYRVKIGKIKI